MQLILMCAHVVMVGCMCACVFGGGGGLAAAEDEHGRCDGKGCGTVRRL